VRVLRESSRAAEQRFGLSGAQLFVLSTLAHEPALSLNELAERTHTHQSTVSVIVSRLVERGLVRRTESEADARRLELSLTAAGRTLVERAPEAAQGRLHDAIGRMGASERARLATLLSSLVEHMELSGEEPGMLFDDEEGDEEAAEARESKPARKLARRRRRPKTSG